MEAASAATSEKKGAVPAAVLTMLFLDFISNSSNLQSSGDRSMQE